MRGWVLLVAMTLVLPGCLDTLNDTFEDLTGEDDEPQRVDRVYYLNKANRLTPAEPTKQDPDRVSMGSFYANWTLGNEQPTWTGPALDQDLRITDAELTFYYTTEQATLTTGPQDQGFPEFVVYLGTQQAPMGWASVQTEDVVVSGQTIAATVGLNLPAGGLILPTHEAPIVKIAPVQTQTDQANEIELLVNGTDAPTQIDLTGHTLDLPATIEEGGLETRGQLAGSAYATGPMEGATSANHTFRITDHTLGLKANLERTQGAGIADIDLEVLDANGNIVAQSVTPEDDEGIALYQPNIDHIGTGTWTLRVVNYGNVAVEYELTASYLAPAR